MDESAEGLEAHRILRALAEQDLFGVYVIQDGVFRFVNDTLADIFGYASTREIVGRLGPVDLTAPGDRDRVRDNIRRRVDGEVPVLGYTFQGLRKDGGVIDVEVYGARSVVGGEPAVSGVLVDITDQKKLEEHVARAQKMEAVGLLASGIAHDFNNILTTIGGHARLLLTDLPDREEILEGLDEIRRAADRATALTRQLLTFARDSRTTEEGAWDLCAVVSDMREMVEAMTGDDVEIEWSLEVGDAWVGVDPGRIGQIVMNLVANARDAMPDGGRMTIRATTEELEEDYADAHFDVEPGSYARLTVQDTGVGISPEVRERIFEPFFSTKERGQGTGLGLATVYGIVQRAGGHVGIYSEPGQGSHFKIHLPLVDRIDAAAPRPEEESGPSPVLEGSERILVVDDDPAVRSVARKILERYGYGVVDVGDAEEAIVRYREGAGGIELLVTDVVLPNLSGPRLVERFRGLGANLRVVYMSGYSEESVNRTARQDPDATFLEKPFDPKSLVSAVRATLDRADEGRKRA